MKGLDAKLFPKKSYGVCLDAVTFAQKMIFGKG